MPRVDLVHPEEATAETKAVYEEIQRDWGGKLFTDFLPLGHSPEILRAVARFGYCLQGEQAGSVSDVRDKELVAIKTSHMNGCEYCLSHNVDFGQAVGLSMDTIRASVSPDYTESDRLTSKQKALIRWTAAVTLNTAAGDDDAFSELRRHYTDAEIVELTLMCGLFNMWNRYTRSLHIEPESPEDRDLIACLARTNAVTPGERYVPGLLES